MGPRDPRRGRGRPGKSFCRACSRVQEGMQAPKLPCPDATGGSRVRGQHSGASTQHPVLRGPWAVFVVWVK